MGDISNEPSMEEILSSIKKIIADDSSQGLSPPRPRRAVARDVRYDELGNEISSDAAASSDNDDEILELTEAVASPPEVAAPVAAAIPISPGTPTADLVSGTTAAVSRNALAQLSALVVKPEVAGSDTLEGLVRDMLKPMLKDWLDARLPELVEALVAKEIARISGRAI
jgi:uncharacterized protein